MTDQREPIPIPNLTQNLMDEIAALNISESDPASFQQARLLTEFLTNPEETRGATLFSHISGPINGTQPTQIETRLYTLASKTLSPSFHQTIINPHNPGESWNIYHTDLRTVFMIAHTTPAIGQPSHNLVKVTLDRQPSLDYIKARTTTPPSPTR